MSNNSSPLSVSSNFEAVKTAEIEDIRTRRQVIRRSLASAQDHGNAAGVDASFDTEDVERDLAGLALSGGGIRSACFNMGLVQAFHASGLYRVFDYLSTVSGGGYIGGFLSTSLLQSDRPLDDTTLTFPLAQRERSQPSSHTRRFAYRGFYLMRPMPFLNKYLIGVTMNNIAVLSAMICMAAAIAFSWRCLDYPAVADTIGHATTGAIYLSGLGSDLMRPLIPVMILFLIWLVCWFTSYFQRQAEAPGRLAHVMLIVTGSALMVAIAVLMGNGDIALPGYGRDAETAGSQHLVVPDHILFPAAAAVALALLPLLRPSRLLNSAVSPQKPWEKWVFNATGTALVAGVPLLFTAILARENISGYSTSPDRPLQWPEVVRWPDFIDLTAYPNSAGSFTTGSAVASKVAALADTAVFWPPQPATFAVSLSRLLRAVQSSEPARDRPVDFYDELQELSKAVEVWGPDTMVYAKAPARDGGDDGDDEMSCKSIPDRVRQRPLAFLRYLGGRIMTGEQRLSTLRHRMRFRTGRVGTTPGAAAEEEERPLSTWHSSEILHDVSRLWDAAGILSGISESAQSSEFLRYRKEFDKVRREKAVYLAVFNLCLLRTPEFTAMLRDKYTFLLSQHPGRMWRDSHGTRAYEALRAAEMYAAGLSASPSGSADRVPGADNRRTKRRQSVEMAALNRSVMEALIPQAIHDRRTYQRRVVIHEDQRFRAKVLLGALLAFLGLGVWVDINATSMHRFYRTLIAQAFLKSPGGKTDNYKLSDLRTTELGGPCHLLGGCISIFRRRLHVEDPMGDDNDDGDESPDNLRWSDTFLMSRRFCGSDVTGYVPTKEYERWIAGETQQFDVAEAVALSGAAVSPSQNRNWLVAFMMFVLNARLGQWLPNPRCGKPRFRPRFFYLSQLMARTPSRRSYCFVSDGGHVENLGLVELLKRRCRLIIVSDASQDEQHAFKDFARAVREARLHHGIEFSAISTDGGEGTGQVLEMKLDDLRMPGKSESLHGKPGSCESHFVAATIVYPQEPGQSDTQTGLLIYVKPSLNGDESLDILEYAASHPGFPHEPTTDQLYDESQTEAYRQLGWHIGCELARKVVSSHPGHRGTPLTLESVHAKVDAFLLGMSPCDTVARSLQCAFDASSPAPPSEGETEISGGGESSADSVAQGADADAAGDCERTPQHTASRDDFIIEVQQFLSQLTDGSPLTSSTAELAGRAVTLWLVGSESTVSDDDLTRLRYWVASLPDDAAQAERELICRPIIEAALSSDLRLLNSLAAMEDAYWILQNCGRRLRDRREAQQVLAGGIRRLSSVGGMSQRRTHAGMNSASSETLA